MSKAKRARKAVASLSVANAGLLTDDDYAVIATALLDKKSGDVDRNIARDFISSGAFPKLAVSNALALSVGGVTLARLLVFDVGGESYVVGDAIDAGVIDSVMYGGVRLPVGLPGYGEAITLNSRQIEPGAKLSISFCG